MFFLTPSSTMHQPHTLQTLEKQNVHNTFVHQHHPIPFSLQCGIQNSAVIQNKIRQWHRQANIGRHLKASGPEHLDLHKQTLSENKVKRIEPIRVFQQVPRNFHKFFKSPTQSFS